MAVIHLTDQQAAAVRAALDQKSAEMAALEGAFRKLPIRRAKSTKGIPYEHFIPSIARDLLVMRRQDPAPRRPARQKDMLKLAKLSGDIVEILSALDFSALRHHDAALSSIQTKLRLLHADAATAAKHAPRSHAPGQPKKESAAAVTQMVALHYERLTGKRATITKSETSRSGEFFALLKTVFDVLGIKASPASQGGNLIPKK